jgi:hypothetical protein
VLFRLAKRQQQIARLGQAIDGDTITISLEGGFGAKRLKIVRSKKAGKDEYALGRN